MQTNYDDRFPIGYAGQPATNGPKIYKTKKALENMDFGIATELANLAGTTVRRPRADQFSINGDVASGHTFGGTITVISKDGTKFVNAVNRPYATSHTATMTALKGDIEILAGIGSVVLSNSNRTVTVTANDDKIVILSVTLGGVAAPDLSYNFTGKFNALNKQVDRQQDSNGEAQYERGGSVTQMTQGDMLVDVEEDFNTKSSVYVRIVEETDKPCGSFRVSAGSPVVAVLWSEATFNNAGSAGSKAEIEINKP